MERGVICEVTPIGLLALVIEVFLSRRIFLFLIKVIFFSHRAHRVHGAFRRTF